MKPTRKDFGAPEDRRFALKIKIKTLAFEAEAIRKAERKTHSFGKFVELRQHRVVDVRVASRATLLAYGYVRGKTFRQCEADSTIVPCGLHHQVAAMVRKYGTEEQSKTSPADVLLWINADGTMLTDRGKERHALETAHRDDVELALATA